MYKLYNNSLHPIFYIETSNNTEFVDKEKILLMVKDRIEKLIISYIQKYGQKEMIRVFNLTMDTNIKNDFFEDESELVGILYEEIQYNASFYEKTKEFNMSASDFKKNLVDLDTVQNKERSVFDENDNYQYIGIEFDIITLLETL